MANTYFQFRQFIIQQDRCAMKVTTDGCLFGSWIPPGPLKGELKILDIGTGTGLLSLMIAQKNPGIIIDAIEIDEEAAKQAAENVNASHWNGRIRVINSDVRSFAFNRKYDFIISNPPFYENELKSPDTKKNQAHHSDDLSLAELFTITRNQLCEKGKFYFLFPYKRKNEIERLLSIHSLFIHQLVLVKQSPAHDYWRVMIEGGLHACNIIQTKEIFIKINQEEYSPGFTDLLKEYYLHL